MSRQSFFFAAILILGTATAEAALVGPLILTVDSTADAVDANPGDGICATASQTCTLRAAVMEGNARDLTAENYVWLMNGSAISSSAPAPTVADPAWKVVSPR